MGGNRSFGGEVRGREGEGGQRPGLEKGNHILQIVQKLALSDADNDACETSNIRQNHRETTIREQSTEDKRQPETGNHT